MKEPGAYSSPMMKQSRHTSPSEPAAAAAQASKRKITVLVADRDEQFRQTLTAWLSDEGLASEQFASGEEVLKAVQSKDFDVAMIDTEMPGMNGLEILKYVRKFSPATTTILMGPADVTLVVEAMKLGAGDYLTKPFTLDYLVPQLKNLLSRRDADDRLREVQTEHSSKLLEDLQNPIQGLKQSIEYLLKGMAGPLGDHQKELMEYMTDSIVRVVDLIGDMKDLTKLDTGRVRLNKGIGNLADLASRVAEEFKSVVQTNKQTLDFYAEPDVPPLEFDSVKMELVTFYLYDFFSKITPPRGSIVVHASKRPIQYEEGRKPIDSVVLSYFSTGSGVPESEVPYLFDRFRNVHSQRSEQQTGWLRLVICDRIVDAHNGKMWAEHHKGKGLFITLALPIL